MVDCYLQMPKNILPEGIPECILNHKAYPMVTKPSKESDIYSLAMTSLSVCTSFRKHPDT